MRVGQTFAAYELVAEIGRGGMGEVWKARDTRLDRMVAIKFVQGEFSDRFDREARAIAALNHVNICTLYDIGPGYLVMEYIEGRPIKGPLPLGDALRLAVEIADALAAAHGKGIIHRDLKPSNILVTKSGVKLVDFGLAKVASSGSALEATASVVTARGQIAGTLPYMSPEQLEGQEADARSDIFAFGAVFYEMLTGRRAFAQPTAASVVAAILKEDPPPLPSLVPAIPAAVDRTLRKCLEKEPGRRWQTATDLRDELAWIADSGLKRPVEVPGSANAAGIAARAKSRRAVHALWVALAAAIGFVALALWPVAPAPPPNTTPFASEAEIETMPAWSPKGDQIAYVADVSGILQVFTRGLGLSMPTQMTRQRSWCHSPFWSGDGTRIYFLSGGGLYSVALAGGQPQLVLSGFSRAAISPDGKSLAVLRRDATGRGQLALSSPVGAPLRPYTDPAIHGLVLNEQASSFAFTRDGRSLGVIAANHGEPQFWRIPVAGGTPQQMAYPGRDFTFFSWLDDGKRIVTSFTGAQYSPSFVMNLGAGTRYALTAGTARDGYPAVSPDGHTLAYSTGEALYGIVEVPLTGAPAREVVASSRQAVAPSWDPDGTHFAYITTRSGVAEISLRNRTDGSEQRIAGQKEFGSEESQFFDCAMSPDGNHLAYRRYWGAHEIWISPLSGEAPVRLWNDPAGASQRGPAWSPDGEWIAYYSEPRGRFAILKIRVGANTLPELVTYTGGSAPPQWSPLGNWIAFRDGNQMRIVSPDGKENKIVSRQRWETYGWSKDGASLYGIVSEEGRHLSLRRWDIATGRERSIADLGPTPPGFDLANDQGNFWYRGFSIHPDGKSFLTSVYRMQTHIWLMHDFDRPAQLWELLWNRR